LSQSVRLTDRRTDGRIDRHPFTIPCVALHAVVELTQENTNKNTENTKTQTKHIQNTLVKTQSCGPDVKGAAICKYKHWKFL